MARKPRRPRHWVCRHPRCPKGVTVYVDLKYIPCHICDVQGSKIYALELEEGTDDE